MNKLIAALAIGVVLCLGVAKAEDYPDAPFVAVVEIGPTSNWVKVQVDLVAVYEAKASDDVVWQQAERLGHYVCSLYGKRGVALSQLSEGTVREPRSFILVACALN